MTLSSPLPQVHFWELNRWKQQRRQAFCLTGDSAVTQQLSWHCVILTGRDSLQSSSLGPKHSLQNVVWRRQTKKRPNVTNNLSILSEIRPSIGTGSHRDAINKEKKSFCASWFMFISAVTGAYNNTWWIKNIF